MKQKNKVIELFEESKKKYDNNSIYIEVVNTRSYVRRKDNAIDSTKSYIKYYKADSKWRSEYFTDWEPQSNKTSTFVSVFDGGALHDYVNIFNKKTGKTTPTELSVNKGKIIYEQEFKYGRAKTLQEIINNFNHAYQILHWIPTESNVEIKEVKTINGYPCTNIIANDIGIKKEACISQDYGVAIYLKIDAVDNSYSSDVNKSIITEYEVKNIKNSELDSINIENKLFELPNIKPFHIYGRY